MAKKKSSDSGSKKGTETKVVKIDYKGSKINESTGNESTRGSGTGNRPKPKD